MGAIPTTAQNVEERLKILGDDFMMKFKLMKNTFSVYLHIFNNGLLLTRGMFLLTKAKRPLKFKMLCGFNKHAVKLRMHKAAPYASPIPLNTF